MKQSLRVLYLAAEADPFIKVGGLGDVAGSLPAALRSITTLHPSTTPDEKAPIDEIEVDVRLVIPFHGVIQNQPFPIKRIATFQVNHVNGPVQAEAFLADVNGLPVYMIAGALIPINASVYTTEPSIDGLKFTFFSLAALELARTLNWTPHIVHANDWHTAPAIYHLFLNRQKTGFYYNTSTVLGLHNLPYLGVGAGPTLSAFGLPPATSSGLPEWAQHLPLPLGLYSADHIVAASPNYAREILTPEFGSGLHDFLRTRLTKISGILNGLDTQRWDPLTDTAIQAQYGLADLETRQTNKLGLQREFGLKEDPNLPLFAMVTRMDNQKGVDLAPDAFRQIAGKPWQAIILGSGDPLLEGAARQLEAEYSDRARAVIRFDPGLSRRVYAGADALLIPSRYEPCGLTQMIAMRYGCVPIARATGGLRDTIQDFDQSTESTGFLFKKPTSGDLAKTMLRALQVFADPGQWQKMQRRGMQQDFSWQRFARQYLTLYLSLANNQGS